MQKYLRYILAVLILAAFQQARAAGIQWSILLYAPTDEEELDSFIAPQIKKLMALEPPPGVELLMEHETTSEDQVIRMVKHPKGQGEDEQLKLPKHDSASPLVFADFLNWAAQKAKGERKLLMVMTHAWGWKGVILDNDIPGETEKETVMPLKDFARAMEKAPLKFDVVFMDACNMGHAEVVEEMQKSAPYLVLSQRETPFSSFPMQSLYDLLARQPGTTGRELACALPAEYVKAYSRGQSMAKAEGEWDIVTAFAVETAKWKPFSDAFAAFSSLLSRHGFREKFQDNQKWFDTVKDQDSNIDMVEFLHRVPTFMPGNEEIRQGAEKLQNQIGYPLDAAKASAETLKISAKHVQSFKLSMEADPFIAKDLLLEKLQEKWELNNQDLLSSFPKDLKYDIEEIDKVNCFTITQDKVTEDFELRFWLPGCVKARLDCQDENGQSQTRHFTREKDYIQTRQFPESSFMISEAHSHGAPFIHGLGIMLEPDMDENEDPDVDPISDLVRFYKQSTWNQKTHWGDLVLF